MANISVPNAKGDEEALQWAAVEKLPMPEQLRTSLLRFKGEDGQERTKQIDVTKLRVEDRQQIIERILHDTEEDNELFLRKLRKRLDRVGIDLPKIEVRYHHLNVEAEEHLGSRAAPSLPNVFKFMIEWPWRKLGFRKTGKINILSDVSGILKPARLTLLLGSPGSGCTSFLRALSGRLSTDLRVSGEVTYNGHHMSEFIPMKTAAYVRHYDFHMSNLTVRETLDFYRRVQGVGDRYDMLTELARRDKELGIKPDADVDVYVKATAVTGQSTNLGTDFVMKLMGLDICADTPVGDAMRRGISGGQKKRLSTAEMLVGPCKAFFLDEISTGLDSSTTFQITTMLQQIAHQMDNTIVVSLLQIPPETYALFDDLILLAEGQIVYQGPCNRVLEFMACVGFRCPPRKATADFLQEVTSRKDQQQYWTDNTVGYEFIPVSEFVKCFNTFQVGKILATELASPYDKTKSHPAALVREKYSQSNRELVRACFARELILMKRSIPIYVSKVIQIAIVSSIAGTLYLRTRMHHRSIDDATLYMGAVFYTLLSSMTAGLPEITFITARLPVYYKDKEMLLYPAWAISLPMVLLRIPWTLLESGSFVIIIYYLAGFSPEPARFFMLFLVLILVNQCTIALARFCGAIGRIAVVAENVLTVLYITMVVLGGFLLSIDNMPVWWKWASWGSILFYSQEAACANEFLFKEWEKPFLNTTLGEAAMQIRGLKNGKNWLYISLGALLGFVIVVNILFTILFQYIKPPQESRAIRVQEATGSPEKKITYDTLPNSSSVQAQTTLSPRDAVVTSSGSDGHRAQEGRERVVPYFQPLSITFDKINYYVDMPEAMKDRVTNERRDEKLQLVSNVSGTFRPGVLTALVGETGAGKTTLLDVLAGRKTVGYMEGEIFISGYPKEQSTFTRISGYCEQYDIHSPNLTVKESLIFSAWMRLSPEIDVQMFVEEVMSLVELHVIQNCIVGLPGVSGLSAEQRKRLTIAVELVANPSIIFMDEPTSGLNARSSAIVMRAVRNIGDTGRTIVCTIHQPSIDIFEAFDELLLLKRGGKTLYAGPLGQYSRHLIEYFEGIPGVPKIKEGYNPSTWMLEITSTSMESRLGINFAETYTKSAAYQMNEAIVRELSKPAPGSRDIEFRTVYAQSFWVQFWACLWKMAMSYWRNTKYTGVKILFTTFMGLFIGSVYWGLGKKRDTQQDVFNIVGAMYAILIFSGYNSAVAIIHVVVDERIVFYREQGAGMYSPWTYAFAQFLIELPYNLLQSVLYTALVYTMIQFEWQFAKVLWFLFIMFFTSLFFVYYGMVCVAITPNAISAYVLIASFFTLFNLFAGYVITRKQMPVWWRWFYWIVPSAWSLHGLVGSQLGDYHTNVAVPDYPGVQITVKEYLRQHYGYEQSFLKYVAIEQVMAVVCAAFAFSLLIKYCNFQRR